MPYDEALSLTAWFNSLKTKEARRSVYQQLLNQLRPDEWREVQARANVQLKRDILGSLPLELVARIVQFLNIVHIIILQRVSKRWNELLSSPLVYSHVLHVPCRYYNHLSVQEQRRIFARHAKRRVMLERGRPVSKAIYESPQLPNSPPTWTAFDYFDGRCAWVETGPDGRGTGIAVRCLRSGAVQRFYTTNREPVSHVRISDTIVATVTMRGYCHVWNHRTGKSGCFRLPSLCYESFIVNGVRVAFCFTTSVTVWDFESRVTRTFRVPPSMVFMTLFSASNSLITVHLCNKNDGTYPQLQVLSKHAQLEVVRHSLIELVEKDSNLPAAAAAAGPSLVSPEREYLDLPLSHNWMVYRFGPYPEDLPWSSTRIETLGLQYMEPEHLDRLTGPRCLLFIMHDSDRDKIVLHTDCWLSRRVVSVAHSLYYYCIDYATKKRHYYDNGDRKPSILISNGHQNYSHAVSDSSRLAPFMKIEDPSLCSPLADTPSHLLYGDSNFVVVIDNIGLEAWCFDETVRPPDSVLLSSGPPDSMQ